MSMRMFPYLRIRRNYLNQKCSREFVVGQTRLLCHTILIKFNGDNKYWVDYKTLKQHPDAGTDIKVTCDEKER